MKDTVNQFVNDFTKTFVIFVVGAFSFVVALAWNDTIKVFLDEINMNNGSVASNLIYTVIITVIAVIIIFFLQRYEKVIKSKVRKIADKKKEDVQEPRHD